MEMKGMMGGIYRISEWIMRFSVINLLWVICSLPFLFVSFLVLTGYAHVDANLTSGDLIGMLVVPLIAASFTLSPATAAMFAVARKWVMNEVDVPLLKTFFRGYKENYLKAMFGGLFFSVLALILLVDFKFFNGIARGGLFYVFIIIFALYAVCVFNFYSLLAHFHMTFWQLLKNAALITIGKPITSLIILVTNAFILYIGLTKFNYFLAVFFMGSLLAYMTFWHFYRAFTKILEKEEKLKENSSEEDAEREPATEAGADQERIFSDRPLADETKDSELTTQYELDSERFRKY